MEQKSVKSTPRDVLMHLLLIITLYVSTFQFVRLVSGLIDAKFPDVLNQYYNPGSSLRWAIATLIILFPTFLWTSRFLRRDIAKSPEKRELKIRRWFLYITLFLAALLIIGDLVALIYNFLEGEITTRFVLKVIVILIVAVAVFRYYLYELKDASTQGYARVFAYSSSIVVLAAIVGGFFIAGSPFKQRLVRFDAQKVGDLQNIQWQIVNYWQQKEKLPATLDELRDEIGGFVPPIDPQTRETYQYAVKGPLSFDLCATFNLSVDEARGPKGAYPAYPPEVSTPYGPGLVDSRNNVWDHPVGEHCFDRTIDPELYPPTPKR